MHLVVFGATGPSGQAVIEAALEAHHHVRAFARRPEALAAFDQRIEVAQGDVRDPEAVRRAVRGADAVLSALGAGRNLGPTTVMSEGTRNIVAAMQAEGVRRLLAVTSAMVTPTGTEPWLFRKVGMYMLRNIHADHLRLEDIVKASDLDWTLVRPPRLTMGNARGVYRLARDAGVPSGSTISRADLGRFMVREAEQREFVRAGVGIAY
jgi:uncharacterized protein YbjT (DUF2867 family)